MPPFFGNATVAPTGWPRVQALAVDAIVPASFLMTIRGTLAAAPGGLYEFDIGNGYIRRVSHTADLTCDANTAGPIIGGRDQAGAFAANSWCYLYALLKTSDLATVGFIVSANAPSVGPSGVTGLGYQSPLFCGAQRIDNGTALAKFQRRNQWTNQPQTLGGSNLLVNTATNPTAVQTTDARACAPPTATEIEIDYAASNLGQTAVNQQGFLSIVPSAAGGLNPHAVGNSITQVASQNIVTTNNLRIAFDGTNIYWNWGLTGVRSAGSTQIYIPRYRENL